jgi:hypothetical protein
VAAGAAARSFSVRVGARTVLVPVAEVERIEADGDYATLHANGKTWLVRERLHNLAMQLDPRQFHRVHRSSIVRLDMIAELRSLTNRDACCACATAVCCAPAAPICPPWRQHCNSSNAKIRFVVQPGGMYVK